MFNINMLKEQFLIVYGLSNDELERLNLRFNGVCKKNCMILDKNMGNYTLASIIGGEIVEVEDRELPKEKVVIFNGFQGVYLQQGVKKVREALGSTPILASTTQNSVKMPLHELLAHLIAEREFYKKR